MVESMLQQPDLVVSLEPSCRMAWNVRRYFGRERAYPFDWWITPARSMLRLLDRTVEFEVSRDDLEITAVNPTGASNTVYNKRLDLLHHHDFERVDGKVLDLPAGRIAMINARYRILFARLWYDADAARAPLAVLNGISTGWPDTMPADAPGRELNGPLGPQELVSAVRARLGEKWRVLIIEIGPSSRMVLDGGLAVTIPDTGLRESDLDPADHYVEPVHVFRAAFDEITNRAPPEAVRRSRSGLAAIRSATSQLAALRLHHLRRVLRRG
ncbi:MAG: hypothetical protein JSV48_16710 [Bradyrhizobium sp.]|nr:MAG: hypothetical protein JSV48_16710 [Bradyrhizobium sp.]